MAKINREESQGGGTAVQERGGERNTVAGREGNGSTRRTRGRSLTRWPGFLAGTPGNPWELMRRMAEEVNQLVPRIEVQQRENELVVRADLPGLRPDDINVTVDRGVLTISGERRQENREEADGSLRSEVSYGTFYRAIPLPDGADQDSVTATFRDGVLEIIVPVAEREQGRRVQVQS